MMQDMFSKRMSEEAAVCAAALGVHGMAVYWNVSSTASTLLVFTALGIYLTLRLLRVIGLPRE